MANINPNEKQSQSQNAQILAWLESGRTLTTLQALELFGCIRLGARISELRSRGANIKTDWMITSTGKRVALYSLNKY